ncbi:MAG: UDP-glucose 4-epimerase GalE [Balneolaceae bacterium]|nr:UDP-glucose 4-epimerase GalE [Balneolaceae bacterium]
MSEILVTGGTGYIGSHMVVELLEGGHQAVIVDNLANSRPEVLARIEELTGHKPSFYEADLRDEKTLEAIFDEHDIDAVIHFAGSKAVGESVEKPLFYYDNNLGGTICLCRCMLHHGVENLVFSSSCTVYGDPDEVPITEKAPVSPYNPYGRTKLYIEEMLRDFQRAHPAWNVALLRYFNPVGAHPSGLIGEDPGAAPQNLMPYITQVAVGRLEKLSVFGDDYPTVDGTGVRDYIHVVDLVRGHLSALRKLQDHPGTVTYNLGTGTGYSVLQMVQAFEQATGREIPYEITGRRAGDVAEVYADPSLARDELGWEAEKGLEEMCRDAWNWQSHNPRGYAGD